MKSLFVFLLLLLPLTLSAVTNSSGAGVAASVVSGTNNIPTAYSTAAGSTILSGLQYLGHLTVQNGTATDIAVSYGTALCASANADQMVVKAGASNTQDFANVQGKVCLRSLGSTISSGTVYAEAW